MVEVPPALSRMTRRIVPLYAFTLALVALSYHVFVLSPGFYQGLVRTLGPVVVVALVCAPILAVWATILSVVYTVPYVVVLVGSLYRLVRGGPGEDADAAA